MAQCDATVDACLEAGVAQAPNISVDVGVRLATQRVKASIEKHREGLTAELAAGSVVCLSPDDDDDDDEAEAVAAKEDSQRMAARLLASGYKQLSTLGVQCPVSLAQHTTGGTAHGTAHHPPTVELGYACVHRHCVYFCASHHARSLFRAHPRRYLDPLRGTFAAPFPLGHVPPTVCVVGGPLSGKTTLARQLCRDTRAVYLTPETVLAWARLPVHQATLPCCRAIRYSKSNVAV